MNALGWIIAGIFGIVALAALAAKINRATTPFLIVDYFNNPKPCPEPAPRMSIHPFWLKYIQENYTGKVNYPLMITEEQAVAIWEASQNS